MSPIRYTVAVCLVASLVSCAQRPRPAPIDAGAYWPTYMGDLTRAPFVRQSVSTDPPTILWSSSVGPGLRGVPVVTDEVIVAASTDRKIQTISRQDGSTLWRKKLDGPPVDPLVIGDRIYTATEDKGRLRALEMAEGDDVWKEDFSSVARPITLAGDTVFAAGEDGSLVALAVSNEKKRQELWRVYFRRAASAGPVVLDSLIAYVAYDSVFVLSREDGQSLARAGSPEIFVGEPATDGTRLYLATERGSIYAWSLPDLEFVWQTSGFGNFISGPVLTQESGYILSRAGELIRFATESGSAEILASADDPVVASPTAVANGLLVGTLSGRLLFFARNGDPIWEVELDGSIETPVIVHEGRIVVPMYSRRRGTLASGSQGRLVELR